MHLNTKVVPVRTFRMVARNISYRNTAGTSYNDQIAKSVVMSSDVRE